MPNGATTNQTTDPTTPIQIAIAGSQPTPNTLTLPRPAPNQLALPPPAQSYSDVISGHEGTGQNRFSSAYGYGQFIKPTWMAYAQANPDKFQGMNEDQILAKRSDQAYGTDATNWLARQNATELQKRGISPTGQSLGIAHYLGAGPAAAVMGAADTDPVSKYVGRAALAANKELNTMTVADMKARYANTPNPEFLGGAAGTAPTAVAAAATPAQPAQNPLALPKPPDPMDMHKMMTMMALTTLLPAGFRFQPVDYHPFQAAFHRGESSVPGVSWGGFSRPSVVLGQGMGPSAPAISPQNVPQFTRAGRRG